MKPIPGFEGRYAATADGRIWSHLTGRFLKPSLRGDGYFYVMLRRDGKYWNRTVHRLVCSAWHGEPPTSTHEANHCNLIKIDNAQSNLEWTTPKENSAHAWANLPAATIAWMRERRSFGAKKMNRQKRTLTPEQVHNVRAFVGAGVSRTKTARLFSISRTVVDRIINKETYRD
jgi:hypothetical protein